MPRRKTCVNFTFSPLSVPRSHKSRQEQSRVLSVALLTNSGNVGGSYKINCFNVVLVSLLPNFLSLIVSFVLVLKLPLDIFSLSTQPLLRSPPPNRCVPSPQTVSFLKTVGFGTGSTNRSVGVFLGSTESRLIHQLT